MIRDVYISASFFRREEALELANVLRVEYDGIFNIVSTWHDEDVTPVARTAPECVERAERDWSQLQVADTAIFLIGDTLSGGGRHTEFGIALQHCDIVICIGSHTSNPFELLPRVTHFLTMKEFLQKSYKCLQIFEKVKTKLLAKDVPGMIKGLLLST